MKPAVVEKYHEPNIAVGHNKKSAFRAIADFFDLKHVKEAVRVTFKRGDDNNRRADIILLFFIMVIILGPMSGLYIKILKVLFYRHMKAPPHIIFLALVQN